MDNPQAFPNSHPVDPCDGMTLRDYFAIHADTKEVVVFVKAVIEESDPNYIPTLAEARYDYADAMLKERANNE